MKKITLLLISFLFSASLFSQDPTITGFTLVNANTDEDILEISEGVQINLLEYPDVEFNIRANTSGDVGSVTMQLIGSLTKNTTESVAPYALFGDFPVGYYYGEMLPVGSYTITGTPYSEASAGGISGEPLSFNFQLVSEPLQRPFITTWKTDNPGVSEDNQIMIHVSPSTSAGPYNFTVDWGDGNSDTGVTGNITHTYGSPGIYQVSISGLFPAISFGKIDGEQKDNLKLLEVNEWGSQKWSYLNRAFDGCSNLDVVAMDIPDLSEVEFMSFMFSDCQSLVFNDTLTNWDVSNVTDMGAMFFAAKNFDQDLSAWDITKIQNFGAIFALSGLSTENYDKTLIGWSSQSVQTGVTLSADYITYCLAEEARQKLIDDFAWSIFDGGRAFDCQQKPFITTWKTDNPGSLIEDDDQITISIFQGEIYNYNVDWGDGTSDSGVTESILHTYPSPGTYKVTISGTFPRINFTSPKIIEVNQWGNIRWSSMKSAFEGCSNLDVVASDVPDLIFVTNMSRMFFECSSLKGDSSFNSWNTPRVTEMDEMFAFASLFNQNLGNWDTSRARDMKSMFLNASSFDQDLSGWNVSQVQYMADMFRDAGLSNDNYDLLLNGWSTQALQNGVNFNAGSSQYCLGEAARQKLIDDFGWTIADGGRAADCGEPQRPFITTWKTDNPGVSEDNQITIPTFAEETYDYIVDWGDGTSDTGVTGDITHTYSAPGVYEVSISGIFPRIGFDLQKDSDKLLFVNQWGDIAWSSMEGAFRFCTVMDVIATDTPDLSAVTNMDGMFVFCQSMKGNSSFGDWDVSNVTLMRSLFAFSDFNEYIGDWDTSNVESMFAVFIETPFDQDLSKWNTAKVTNTVQMFSDTPFNQDISNWEVSNVINMNGMFERGSFDQNIADWDVSQVTDLSGMFFQSGISTLNYDSTLIGWSTQRLQNDVKFGAGSSQFCSAGAARQKLINDFGWTITDGGIAENCDFCPTTQITLTTQQQVDDFATTYDIVNCTFEGGIRIEGPDVVNLDGLSGLSYVAGFLNIVNTQITNLDGLSSVFDVGTSLLIQNNSLLKDIDGLSSIAILNKLSITGNDQLTNVNGLSLLNSIGTLLISGNPSLINIDGLNALTQVFGDLIIENNISLSNLEGLSSLQTISDSLIIKNNASLTNLDGLSSLVFLDNNLIVVSNQALTNLGGLSNLNSVGLDLTIQSNPVLETLDGLSSVTSMFANLSIVDNDRLTSLSGLANLNSVGGDMSIIGNRTLSDCAIQAVCDSDTIVGGLVTISGNSGNCIDLLTARSFCTAIVETNVSLLEATYLQGANNPEPTGPILRVEKGNRETYLKFDMSTISGDITEARLEMQVASDPGNGNLQVFLGSSSEWTETGLNGGNKPIALGNAIAAINGTHALGQTKVWNLDVESLSSDDELTLVIKQSSGNDVAFASDETAQAPKLFVTYSAVPEVQRPFMATFKTDYPGVSEDNQITIPTFPGETYDYTVEWGDGTSDSGVMGDITHTYTEIGTYQVSITGVFPRISYEQLSQGANKVVSIDQWGDIKWNSMHRAFYQSSLEVLATDVPDLSNVEDISGMFLFCPLLKGNGSFENWDTSNVRNMDNLFAFTDFNQDIGNWDTSKVESMFAVFIETPFNQDISGWDVSKVQNTVQLFSETPFNQDISNWNVSEVIDMNSMFERSSFDQDLSNWPIGKVTDMSGMFYETGMSTSNYDATLNGWSSQQLLNGVVFDGGNSQYCLSEAARQKLIDDFGWIVTDGGKAEDCTLIVEGEADLIHATYLQRGNNPEPNGSLLRVEKGIRETYLKFDVSDFTGSITEARLEMQVASDPGNGTVEVFLGSNSNWTETGLNGSNKPIAVGGAIAAIGGAHAVGQTKVWNLDVASLSTGGELTLIVKQSSGNDVAFASDETFNAPSLYVTTTSINSLGSGANLSGILKLSPNPAVNDVRVSFESPQGIQLVNDIMVYDTSGRLVRSVSATEADLEGAFEIDVRSLQSGIYFIRTYDENGVPYQKQMAIER